MKGNTKCYKLVLLEDLIYMENHFCLRTKQTSNTVFVRHLLTGKYWDNVSLKHPFISFTKVYNKVLLHVCPIQNHALTYLLSSPITPLNTPNSQQKHSHLTFSRAVLI